MNHRSVPRFALAWIALLVGVPSSVLAYKNPPAAGDAALEASVKTLMCCLVTDGVPKAEEAKKKVTVSDAEKIGACDPPDAPKGAKKFRKNDPASGAKAPAYTEGDSIVVNKDVFPGYIKIVKKAILRHEVAHFEQNSRERWYFPTGYCDEAKNSPEKNGLKIQMAEASTFYHELLAHALDIEYIKGKCAGLNAEETKKKNAHIRKSTDNMSGYSKKLKAKIKEIEKKLDEFPDIYGLDGSAAPFKKILKMFKQCLLDANEQVKKWNMNKGAGEKAVDVPLTEQEKMDLEAAVKDC